MRVSIRGENCRRARRGGYRFELNGLFERVPATSVLTSEAYWGGSFCPSSPASFTPRTYRLLLVDVENEQWIADLGFGG